MNERKMGLEELGARALKDYEAMQKPAVTHEDGLDLVELWPDLFEGMTAAEADVITGAFVSIWHEGWIPNRGDVAALIERRRGNLSSEDYLARARAKSQRAK